MIALAVAVLVVHLGNRQDGGILDGPSMTDVRVVRVVDGDTIVVEQGGDDVRVRLLGIDTPETVKPDSPVECFGPEASARATELLDGQTVRLEYDPSQDAVDAYGRTLAYVWLGDVMVNQTLVAEGYAREYTYSTPGVHQAALATAQDDAKAHERGLWSSETCAGHA
ncbi:thermonuclease family protein [Cellulomonas sp. ES6]|uniref:thermonuclease family protein n=1 Tax=Cellulomonas sp. ES6 TaxID=3039384 RepID=UPI0024B842F9|nr:thermonuclease family protein [Cellulomonas sp. ES6]WHP16579.1 thermonuclease family protein [Cellulomonas sp. ES6]